ncbi:MAG: hypothetical protein Ct9H90mP5_11430 [Acidimicrobiaceae bacterium]|nr:MAG: hypothetical protein Ct9H90mP5_11430 [Acidimicrobiaceae bacterium]
MTEGIAEWIEAELESSLKLRHNLRKLPCRQYPQKYRNPGLTMTTNDSSSQIQGHYGPLFESPITSPISIDRGEGSYVWDVEGNQYLDFFGGVLTTMIGHNNQP